MLGKFTDAITSTECLAAFLGALAAFLLEAWRRWRSDTREQWMAGNEAVFALAQMYSLVVGIHRQQFEEQIARFKREHGRDPNYSEFLPMEVGESDVMRPRLDALGFLLRSHDPDVLNRLAVVRQQFDVFMHSMRQLNEAQNQWQQSFARVLEQHPSDLKLEQIEDYIGPYLTVRLQTLVQSLQQGLPECAKDLKMVGEQLSESLSFSFPAKMISRFAHIERTGPVLPPGVKKPKLWRRCVRAISRVLRRMT